MVALNETIRRPDETAAVLPEHGSNNATVELRVHGLRLFPSHAATLGFALHTGETLVVLGRNGTGKSQLINLLAGIYPVPRGVIRFGEDDAGDDLGLMRLRQRRVGVVFQQPALLRSLSIFENLALPLRLAHRHAPRGLGWQRRKSRAEIRDEVQHLLALVGVPHCEDLYPHELSVGNQQCVALARALAGNKRVLLCDEPTADLSPDKAFQIDELLAGLVRGGVLRAAVVCTQNLETAFRLGSRFLLLGDGENLGQAEHCEDRAALRARPAFQRLLRLPSEALFWSDDHDARRSALGRSLHVP